MSPQSLVPAAIRGIVRRQWHALRALAITVADFRRFHSSAAPAGRALNDTNRRALLMYHTHSVEKGLARSNFRPGFGARPVGALAELMNRWIEDRRPTEDSFFEAACDTLRAYIDRHEELGFDISDKVALFSDEAIATVGASRGPGGTRSVRAVERADGSFLSVVKSRVSVRDFADEKVDMAVVLDAVGVAALSPSACNRQAARAHLVTDGAKIAELLRIQGGFAGYGQPPLLILVTGDAGYYVEATERNQPYIDGALFAMTLMYALEANGLGTCALTAMMWPAKEKRVRRVLNLPESECLVTFMAVGARPDAVDVPFSRRARVDEISTIH